MSNSPMKRKHVDYPKVVASETKTSTAWQSMKKHQTEPTTPPPPPLRCFRDQPTDHNRTVFSVEGYGIGHDDLNSRQGEEVRRFYPRRGWTQDPRRVRYRPGPQFRHDPGDSFLAFALEAGTAKTSW